MKNFVLATVVLFAGCAQLIIEPVKRDDKKTRGMRVYEPMPLLIVTKSNANVVFVPNYSRGYAIRWNTVLAKNKIKLQSEDGILTMVSTEPDTTGLLTFLQALGTEAIKQADKLKALGAEVPGTITGKEGVYRFVFDAKGNFTGLTRLNLN